MLRILGFLFLFCASSAHAVEDYRRLPMCQKINRLPTTAYALEGCKLPATVEWCKFGLSDNSAPIEYVIENNKLVYKEIRYVFPEETAYGIAAKDNLNTIKFKLSKFGIKNVYDFRKKGKYLKSAPIYCSKNHFYNIYIYYKRGNSISSIAWEIPGPESGPDD